MTRLIVDASVAVKWFAEEPASDRARSLFITTDDLTAPTLIVADVGNALWKKSRKALVSAGQARDTVVHLPRFFADLHDIVGLAPRASELAALLDHPIHDCFYLALAERERLPLVSGGDRMLAAAARLDTITARAL